MVHCGTGIDEERALGSVIKPGGYELRVAEFGYVEVDQVEIWVWGLVGCWVEH